MADALASGWELPPFQQLGNALVTEDTSTGEKLVLVKPLTFMNLSGAALVPFLKIPEFTPERDLLIITDDFAIPLGTFRLRASGSSGGHHGLQNIEQTLGSQSYARLRVGIGPLPAGGGKWSDFVLAPFSPAELDKLSDLLPEIADAIDCWLNEGIEVAMSRFNRKHRPDEEPTEE